MAKVKRTPNIDHCLEIFKKASENISDTKLKDELDIAVEYVTNSFDGVKQPNKGITCPIDRIKVKSVLPE